METKQHLFVSGVMGRSGTTLMELVLNSHSDIVITPENYCFQYLFDLIADEEKYQDKAREIEDSLLDDKKMQTWPNYQPNYSNFVQTTETIPDLIDLILKDYAKSKKDSFQIIGNKRGFYAKGYAKTVKSVYPNAKFLFTYRDPRDIVNSCMKNFKNHPLEYVIKEIMVRHHFVEETIQEYPESVCIVKYEDLVIDPKKELSRICNFLGITFQEEMIHFYKNNQNGEQLVGVTSHIHSNSKKPFNSELAFQWKRNGKLAKNQLHLIEGICEHILDKYNYERSTKRNNFVNFIPRRRVQKQIKYAIGEIV